MNDKILVRVRVPMADDQFDFRLPADASAGPVTQTLVAMLKKQSSMPLLLQQSPELWLAGCGWPLEPGKTLREQGVKDSDLLFLI